MLDRTELTGAELRRFRVFPFLAFLSHGPRRPAMNEQDFISWKKLQQKSLSRRNLIRGAAGTAAGAGLVLGSAGAASLSALLPSLNALAKSTDNGHRIFTFVS